VEIYSTRKILFSVSKTYGRGRRMFLSKEQVEELDYQGCLTARKQLARTYRLDRHLYEWMTPELWNDLDLIANTLLYLEDRIYQFEDVRYTTLQQ
jgi:hypothetical protein